MVALLIGLGVLIGLGDSLPFRGRRPLSRYDLARKREGWVIVGYPAGGYDALRTIGFAGVLSLAYNGRASSPTFAYEPYRYYFFLQAGFFLRESRYARFLFDAPWVKGSPYRLSLRLNYREESQGQFWGLGEAYLGRFQAAPSLGRYERQLAEARQDSQGVWVTRAVAHYFYITQWQAWISGERTLLGGRLRLVGSLRTLSERLASLAGRRYEVPTPTGEKVWAQQQPTTLDSALQGFQPLPPNVEIHLGRWQWRTYAGLALVWDTRDFEISPSRGWLIEGSYELRFSFSTHRLAFGLRNYHLWYQSPSQRWIIVGALHGAAIAQVGGLLPLTDLQAYNRWADFRSSALLAGPLTVRAFRENRFVTPFAYLFQYELRTRMAEAHLWHQHFMGGPVVFADLATGTDTFRLPRRVIYGVGAGMRILWNMNLVIRADLAWGREGLQLHLTTTHPF
ncbi:MAG: DUF5982 domain-containing protein [Bacteroidia bacterium]